ncbi:Gustatory receptor 105b, partial [Halyomorpha halys]
MAGAFVSDIFNVPRILGLFPLDVKFQLSKKWIIYASLLQLINILIGIRSVTLGINFTPMIEEKFMMVFPFIDVIDRSFAHMRQVFTVVYIVRKQESIFELFNKINQTITRHGSFPIYRFRFTRNCLILIACLVMSPISWDPNFINITQIINCSGLLINFSSALSIVGQFWDLMQVLTGLVHDKTYELNESSIDAMENLSTIGESIGEIYGPILLIFIVSCFPRLIMDLYAVLMHVFPHMLTANILMLLSAFMGSFFVSSTIYSINKFLNQIDEFNNKLLWKMLNDKTGRYIENEKFNFHFTAYKAIKFTACGFFNMDYSLISSMISVCTTYLVIVLQYGKSS